MKKLLQICGMILLCAVIVSCARNRGPEHFYFGNYSEAEQFYNKGEYQKAIEKYRAYIDENPEGNLAVISQYYIAKSHVALNEMDKATEIFKKIKRDYPDLVWASFAETQLKDLQSAPSK